MTQDNQQALLALYNAKQKGDALILSRMLDETWTTRLLVALRKKYVVFCQDIAKAEAHFTNTPQKPTLEQWMSAWKEQA